MKEEMKQNPQLHEDINFVNYKFSLFCLPTSLSHKELNPNLKNVDKYPFLKKELKIVKCYKNKGQNIFSVAKWKDCDAGPQKLIYLLCSIE